MSQPSPVSHAPEECAWCMGRGRDREDKCRVCKGRGAVLAAQPARPCHSCAGSGRAGLIGDRQACPSCGGAGWERQTAQPSKATPAAQVAAAGRKAERRRSPRAPMTLPVTWGRTGESPREADTGDLSLGGCFVMTTEAVRVGERVLVTLPCEATAGLRVCGEVAYRMEIGFGVRFAEMPQAARAALTLLLADYYRDLESAGRFARRPQPASAPQTTSS